MRISDWSSDVCSSDLFGDGFTISLGAHEPVTQSLGYAIDCAIGDGKFRTRIREHRIVERRESGVQDCAGDSKVLSGLIPMQVHGDQHCAVLDRKSVV